LSGQCLSPASARWSLRSKTNHIPPPWFFRFTMRHSNIRVLHRPRKMGVGSPLPLGAHKQVQNEKLAKIPLVFGKSAYMAQQKSLERLRQRSPLIPESIPYSGLARARETASSDVAFLCICELEEKLTTMPLSR